MQKVDMLVNDEEEKKQALRRMKTQAKGNKHFFFVVITHFLFDIKKM